jgi:hypothetical protein
MLKNVIIRNEEILKDFNKAKALCVKAIQEKTGAKTRKVSDEIALGMMATVFIGMAEKE